MLVVQTEHYAYAYMYRYQPKFRTATYLGWYIARNPDYSYKIGNACLSQMELSSTLGKSN